VVPGLVAATAPLLTAPAAGLGRPLTILGEVTWIVPRAAAAAAALTALPPGLSCPFAIVGKVARAVLPAELTGPRGLFAILRKVTGIRCTSLFGHFSTPHIATSDVAFASVRPINEPASPRLSSRLP
jgi:hypothetical protein